MGKNVSVSTKDISFARVTSDVAPASLEISHCHDTYEILLVIDGRGKYVLEGTEISVASGTLLLSRPLEYHCIKIDAGQPYERYVIQFTEAAILPELSDTFEEAFSADRGMNMYTDLSFSEPALAIFERFMIAENLPEEKRQPYMRLLLSELITLLSARACEIREADNGELGARVIRYLNDNIDKDISLDRIAKRFFVSKYYLCRAFKKHNGISVHGYISRKRVMLAKQLIASGETASGAAYRVGFGDYSAFYRAYIKVLGEPPSVKGAKGRCEDL